MPKELSGSYMSSSTMFSKFESLRKMIEKATFENRRTLFTNALRIAAADGNFKYYDHLVQNSGRLSLPGIQGATREEIENVWQVIVRNAAYKGDRNLVFKGLLRGASSDHAVYEAARAGNTDLVNKLVEMRASLSAAKNGAVMGWQQLRESQKIQPQDFERHIWSFILFIQDWRLQPALADEAKRAFKFPFPEKLEERRKLKSELYDFADRLEHYQLINKTYEGEAEKIAGEKIKSFERRLFGLSNSLIKTDEPLFALLSKAQASFFSNRKAVDIKKLSPFGDDFSAVDGIKLDRELARAKVRDIGSESPEEDPTQSRVFNSIGNQSL